MSALLAAVEGQLFVFVEALEPKTFDLSSTSGQALLFFTFMTFLLSIGATVSSLILTDQVGELPIRAFEHHISNDSLIKGTSIQVMKQYGLSRKLGWFMWHWVSMLVLGYLCLLVQIIIYVWVTQSVFIRASVLVATFWILLPLLFFLWPSSATARVSKELGLGYDSQPLYPGGAPV